MINSEELYKLIKRANEEQTAKLSDENDKQTKLLKEEIRGSVREVHERVDAVIKEVEDLKKKNLILERKQRKNNVAIFGLKVEKENLLQNTLDKINNLLECHIQQSDINNIYSVHANKNPPIILSFVSFLKRQALFRNIKKLKGTGIAIADYLCYEDREEKKLLLLYQFKARAENIDAKIKGSKLSIGKKTYSLKELKQLESKTETEHALVEEVEEVVEIQEDNERIETPEEVLRKVVKGGAKKTAGGTGARKKKGG